MMPNITRGSEMKKLVFYLFGPGRANEHVDPRMIGSHDGLMTEGAPRFTEDGQLVALAAELEAPRTLFGVDVSGGHVWHCSMSLPPEDGELTDEQWLTVARRTVEAMGFGDEGGSKAPCRWLAVHHGKSTGGDDHIHLVVNLVREDGTKASTWLDYSRSQGVAAQLESEFSLRTVEGRQHQRTMPGVRRGEAESARRRGLPEPARTSLARSVRAAAVGSRSEADFVRSLRSAGVLALPRYAKGGRSEVVGYSVALKPQEGSRPVWYGGGKLAKDLTLTCLRQCWPDGAGADALSVWSSRADGRPARPSSALRDRAAWEMAARYVSDMRTQLAGVEAGDVVRWGQVAHEAAGVFAAWSSRLESRPGPLARAADVLSRSAQRPRVETERRDGQLHGVVMIVGQAQHDPWGEMLFVQQMRNLMRLFHDLHTARGERDQARAVADSATGGLAELQQRRQDLATSPGSLPQPAPRTEMEQENDSHRRGFGR